MSHPILNFSDFLRSNCLENRNTVMKVAFDIIYGMLIVLKETITLEKEHVGGGNLSHL